MINLVRSLGGLTELMYLISTLDVAGNVHEPIISWSQIINEALAKARMIAVQRSNLVIMPPRVY